MIKFGIDNQFGVDATLDYWCRIENTCTVLGK